MKQDSSHRSFKSPDARAARRVISDSDRRPPSPTPSSRNHDRDTTHTRDVPRPAVRRKPTARKNPTAERSSTPALRRPIAKGNTERHSMQQEPAPRHRAPTIAPTLGRIRGCNVRRRAEPFPTTKQRSWTEQLHESLEVDCGTRQARGPHTRTAPRREGWSLTYVTQQGATWGQTNIHRCLSRDICPEDRTRAMYRYK